MIDWYEVCKKQMMKGKSLAFESDDWGRVITATSYLALVQLFGFLKYKSESRVFLRGQTSSHPTHLQPSAFRGGKSWESVSDEIEQLIEVIRIKCSIDAEEEEKVSTEPLLQHYGLRTRWLDIVDSIPHALFFALNSSYRINETSLCQGESPTGDWGYIYIIDCRKDEAFERKASKGIWRAEDGFMLCDLRRAKSSKALRPHVQHGWLCRVREKMTDLDDQIMVRVRIPRSAASTWIGGECFTWDVMFPIEDRNYNWLLKEKANQAIQDWQASASRTLDPGRIITYLPSSHVTSPLTRNEPPLTIHCEMSGGEACGEKPRSADHQAKVSKKAAGKRAASDV